VEITSKGRESIFLRGSQEDTIAVLLSDGVLNAKKLSSDSVLFPLSGVSATYMGTPSNAAVMYTADTMAPIRSKMACIGLTGQPTDLLAPVDLKAHRHAQDHTMGTEVARVFSLGKSDVAICKNLATLPLYLRRKVAVFLAGMLGQDLADRLRGILKVGRVLEQDIRTSVLYQIQRYKANPEIIPGLLVLYGEFLPPAENVAIHLALGYENAS